MVEINHSFERGDKVKIVFEEIQYEGDGTEKRVEQEDAGEIIAAPSNKFNHPKDDFDFDYKLINGNAVRSVDINSETVAQLLYDAGGDRDWEQWKLLEITRIS